MTFFSTSYKSKEDISRKKGTTMIQELIHNMQHASTAGTYGVAAIYIYLAVIVVVALLRIRQFSKEEHH